MIRKVIEIDRQKCNGCGLCADACHEGAIVMVEGKAQLLREDYCDGLGDCLPACPTGAITFTEREAPAYDKAAVAAHLEKKAQAEPLPCGCPGTHVREIQRPEAAPSQPAQASELTQWPVQIKLVPARAPYFDGCHLLIAADCAAYACGAFHSRFLKGKKLVVGCPKLDMVDYTEKLAEILTQNDVQSMTVVRMEVPCCGGLEHAAKTALQKSGKFIPWQVVTLSVDGRVLE